MTQMTEQHENYRNKIITKSQAIFERFGYKKTTIADIARALTKGKSSIYYYFNSKEEIYIAVLEAEANQLKKKVLQAVNAEPLAESKIKAYIETRMLSLKNLTNLNNYIQNSFLPDERLRKLRESYDNVEIKIILDILNYGIHKNRFSVKNPELTAIMLLTIIKSLEIPVLNESLESLQDRIDELLPILFHGIAI